MRDDGVPWRGAHEKHHEFFSIICFAPTDNDDIIMDWQCGVGLFFISLNFTFLFFSCIIIFCTCCIFYSLLYSHILFFYCSRGFRHSLPLHSMPYCDTWVRYLHLQVFPLPHAWAWARAHFPTNCSTMGFFLLLDLERWWSKILICCVRKGDVGF